MAENTIKDVKLKIGTDTQFQIKLKDLPINTLVGITDPIQEGELDTSIISKLNKADNSLPKPTNDTTGSAGQVLKKTANGSEWGDVKGLPEASPSVGEVLGCTSEGTPSWVSGPADLYMHYMTFETSSNNEKIALTKISTNSSSFSNLNEAYSDEIANLNAIGDTSLKIPVVGSIDDGQQTFSAIAIDYEAIILFGESGSQLDVSDLTNWADNPFKI